MREGSRFAGDYEVRFGSARISESYSGIFDFDVARFALPFDTANIDVRGIEFVPSSPRDSMGFRLEGSSRGAAGKLWIGKQLIDNGYDLTFELGLTGASDIGVDISKSSFNSYRDKYDLGDDLNYSAKAAKYGYYANARLSGESSSAQVTLARYGVSGELPFMLDSGANYSNRSLEQRQTTLGLFRLVGPENNDLRWNFSAYWASIYSNMTSQPPSGYFGLMPSEPAKSDERRYGGDLSAETEIKTDGNWLDWKLGVKLEYESGKYYSETDTSVNDYPNVERMSGSIYSYFIDRKIFVSIGPDVYQISRRNQKKKFKNIPLRFEMVERLPIEDHSIIELALRFGILPPKMREIIGASSLDYKNDYFLENYNFNYIFLISNELYLETNVNLSGYKDSTRWEDEDNDDKYYNFTYDAGLGLRYKADNLNFFVDYDYFKTERISFSLPGEFHSLLLEAKMKAFSEKLDFTGQFRRVQFKDPINLLGAEAVLNLEPARFFARFDNILNESYDISPGFPASGISFVVGVRYDAGMF